MRAFWPVLFCVLASEAMPDECEIFWLDLFIPPAESEFEISSESSGSLTLHGTTANVPISFDLAKRKLISPEGKEVQTFVGTRTIAVGGISNDVTVSVALRPGFSFITFSSNSFIRAADERYIFG
ncbi:hypothetical protein [Poseidonocella sp. HB161398]|uniref:hypothetical protein n=1 Tax=Poseidonocella sp. HB161398 TaxID=2320855 RepID=UPI001107E747|nr:hypothetical protein [Poseidonocella sp. HB161398]